MPDDHAPNPPPAPRKVLGRPAGQRERLIPRLRDLAGSYPAGVGLLKEFLQNSDDAGATRVRFVLDLREHPTEGMPDDRMAALFGPALMVSSDQSFTPEDVLNIQDIGASGKIVDAGKTGRFGLGFNTVYSITDYPSFATRDLIMAFDPYFDTVAHKGDEPGREWGLAEMWSEAPNWPRAFDLDEGVRFLDRWTVFRLPLRTAGQVGPERISRTAFSADAVRGILESLATWGERLVLFLRSVVEVEAVVIGRDGREELLARVSTVNPTIVQDARLAVLPSAGEHAMVTLERLGVRAPAAVYEHSFLIDLPGGRRESDWLVCQGMFVGDNDEVVEAATAMIALGEKAVPLGGAALRVRRTDAGLRPLPTEGTLCCTLPIPQPLPIDLVLNAPWSLASSRAQVRFGDAIGEEAPKIGWNQALAGHVVPGAAAMLMEALTASLDESGALDAYAAWPDLGRLTTGFDLALGEGIYAAFSARCLLRIEAAAGPEWVVPSEGAVAAAWSKDLADALIADGLALARPTPPSHVLHGLGEEGPDRLTPARTRKWLSQAGTWEGSLSSAPRRCLQQRERVLELFWFCSEGGVAKLAGLPLALMEDGALRTFGVGYAICLGGAQERRLFRDREEWFLAEEIETSGAVRVGQDEKLTSMTPGFVIANLPTHLPKDTDGVWSPSAETFPNELWLTELYEWLVALPDLKPHLAGLKALAIIPDGDGHLIRPAGTGAPLLPTLGATRPLCRALGSFGIPLVTGSPAFLTAARALASTPLLQEVTPDEVVKRLAASTSAVLPNSPHRRELLNWLSDAFEQDQIPDAGLDVLRTLAIWPTKDGRIVAANAERTFLPKGYLPPEEFERVTLLQPGPDDRWTGLLARLGVEKLALSAWIHRAFLPCYGDLSSSARVRALAWLRDHGWAALTEDEEATSKLRERIRETPLIEATDGILRKPAELYDLDARDTLALLGPVASVPDLRGAYRDEPEAWATFFTRLRLRREPLDRDLLARVEQLVSGLSAENGEETESALLDVYDYLGKRWSKEGEHDKSELARKLKDLAWVPTVQRPAHDDDVALFVQPTTRLVVPRLAYPARLIHHAASRVGFVAGGRENADVRRVLGMPADLHPDLVGAHFLAVRDAWRSPVHSGLNAVAVAKTAGAFYRLLGSLAATTGPNLLIGQQMLRSLVATCGSSPCIWDSETRRFWPGKHTFANAVGPLVGLRACIVASGQEGAGLDALGRRPAPVPADCAAVLRELSAQSGEEPLTASVLKAALHCWNVVGEEHSLLLPDLPVPTGTGCLVKAKDSLVDDAHYWRKRLAGADLPWVHDRVPSATVLAAGAARASVAVHELRDAWTEEPSVEVERFCANRSAHLGSAELAFGLMRLLAHQEDDEDLPDLERVRHALHLELVPCGALSAGLVCPDFGVEDLNGVEPVICLLDRLGGAARVWVASDDADAVAHELGRALVRRLGDLGFDGADGIDRAALEAILRCETRRIEGTLDRRTIRSLAQPIEDGGAEDQALDESESFDQHQFHDDDEDDGDPPSQSDAAEPTAAAGSPGGTAGASGRPGPSDRGAPTGQGGQGSAPPHPTDAHGTPGSGAGTGQPGHMSATGSHGHSNLPPIDAPPRLRVPLTDRVGSSAGPHGPPVGPASAPVTPHQGQTTPASRGRGQFYSYLLPPDATQPGDPGGAPGRLATERAALDHVDAIERARGWTVTPMASENEGFDREIQAPGDAQPRIVEVKGLAGAWDARGVRLTPAELRAAHAFKERYWVYVVEFARDEAHRRLYRLRNPAGQATAYCLDHGWAVLDEAEAVVLVPVAGLVVHDGETRVGVIMTVVANGEARRMTVKAADGLLRELNWNPARYRLSPEAT